MIVKWARKEKKDWITKIDKIKKNLSTIVAKMEVIIHALN